ncbi:MAG: hypothetical protein ACO3LT_09760 [Ilumatobacteraceae bacterium]
MRQIGLTARTRWAGVLLRRLKAYIDARTISPDAPGFIRTPSGLMPIQLNGMGADAEFYPFQIIGHGESSEVSFKPGTVTASVMDSGYSGTPTVGGTSIAATTPPRLTITAADMRAYYYTTWEGIDDGGAPTATLAGATLMSCEIVLREASNPPTNVAPTVVAATGAPDTTGEFYQQIGIVQIIGGERLSVFNDTVRSSHRVVFCIPDDYRPYPVT